jgi:hypothetical protein
VAPNNLSKPLTITAGDNTILPGLTKKLRLRVDITQTSGPEFTLGASEGWTIAADARSATSQQFEIRKNQPFTLPAINAVFTALGPLPGLRQGNLVGTPLDLNNNPLASSATDPLQGNVALQTSAVSTQAPASAAQATSTPPPAE